MVENGSHVTRAELEAHMAPLRSDIREIKGDVKTLIEANAAGRAVSGYQRFIFGTIGVGGFGAVATLVWLAAGGH